MHLDRLTTLFQQAQFTVATHNEYQQSPALELVEQGRAIGVRYHRIANVENLSSTSVWFDFGGKHCALYHAIPESLSMTVTENDRAWAMAKTIVTEIQNPRCGGPVMLNRLVEVLMIYLLRDAIETGTHMPGILLGLADNHLKFALVAIHDKPGYAWSVDELAHISSMSRTLFYKRFNELVGYSPLQYLRQWRLTLARLELKKGQRISSVALDFGYRSSEGFSRAFHQHFGVWPGEVAAQRIE